MRLGMPVQAQNDRQKVNPFFSQVTFIEFLVSPFLFGVMKILPPMEPSAEQMVHNAEAWCQCWQEESLSPPGEIERKGMAERVAKLEVKYQECRTQFHCV